MNTDNMPPRDMSLPKPAEGPSMIADTPNAATDSGQGSGGPVSVATDSDVIEQSWITRVEQLFRAHGDDPHILAEQFADLKAEYIAQRYGKNIKKAEK